MAKTIEQIQALIDAQSLDARQLVNLLADYLQANPPGAGGSFALESYQNSAMSAPVQAYVYRDADDNIVRVYEPVRNNRVSRSQLAYAESIDKFPFDNPANFDCDYSDVKLIWPPGINFSDNNSCKKSMVINIGDGSVYEGQRHNQTGTYGVGCPHDAEIYILSNGTALFRFMDCTPSDNTVYPGYFDNLGPGAEFKGSTLKGTNIHDAIAGYLGTTINNCIIGSSDIYFNNKTATLYAARIDSECAVHFTQDDSILQDVEMGPSCEIVVGAGTQQAYIKMGTSSTIGDPESDPKKGFVMLRTVELGPSAILKPTTDNTDSIDGCYVGVGAEVTTNSDVTGQKYEVIDGITYLKAITDIDGVLTETATAI